MKLLVFAGVLAATATAACAADAPKASCLDPGKSYIARPLNNHDVFAQQSIGAPKAPVRIKTSCAYLGPAIGIGLSAQFTCVSLGDTVVATVLGGERESCVVTRVLPYAPEEGDIKKAGQ
jgi:hypothetical protein